MALKKVRRTLDVKSPEKTPRSRAFFLELILNLLIFSLCAVVALQVFVESKLSIEESAAITQLSLDAQSLAEEFKATGGKLEGMSPTSGGSDITYYYDSNLVLTDAEHARYSLVITNASQRENGVAAITIDAYAGEKLLFSLQGASYQPREGR